MPARPLRGLVSRTVHVPARLVSRPRRRVAFHPQSTAHARRCTPEEQEARVVELFDRANASVGGPRRWARAARQEVPLSRCEGGAALDNGSLALDLSTNYFAARLSLLLMHPCSYLLVAHSDAGRTSVDDDGDPQVFDRHVDRQGAAARRADDDATALAPGNVASLPSSPCSTPAAAASVCARLRGATALGCQELRAAAPRLRGRRADGCLRRGLRTPDTHFASCVYPYPSRAAHFLW